MKNLLNTKFSISLLVFLVGFSLLSVGVVAANDQGALKIANPTDIKKLDPIFIQDEPSSRVAGLIFDHLATYDFNGEVIPELAKSWEFSESGDEVTFTLREDVRFHDGTKFNAEAVKFTFERIMDPEWASPQREKFTKMIEDIVVLDEYTVKFVLKSPNAAFIDLYIIDNAAMMISPASVEKYGEDVTLHPVGTGPFEFSEYREAEYVELTKNEDYWRGTPKLDKVIFKPIPELQSRIVELETGGVDLIFRVPPEELPRLEGDDSITVKKSPYASIRGLWFNADEEFFASPDVRRALSYAVDADKIYQALLKGVAIKGKSVVPVNSWAYDEDVPGFEYDPEKARTMLEEAGWVDTDGDGVREKDGKELKFTLMSPDGRYLRDKEISEAVTHMWKGIGADVDVEVLEWGGFIDKLFAQDYQMVFLGWMQSTFEPAKFFNPLVQTGGRANFFGYSNEELDNLLDEATRTFDQSARKELYEKAQEIFMSDAEFISLYNHLGMVAHTDELEDYKYSASRSLDLLEANLKG